MQYNVLWYNDCVLLDHLIHYCVALFTNMYVTVMLDIPTVYSTQYYLYVHPMCTQYVWKAYGSATTTTTVHIADWLKHTQIRKINVVILTDTNPIFYWP